MGNFKKAAIYILIVMIFMSVSVGCQPNVEDEQVEPISDSGFLLGTIVTITLFEESSEDIFTEIFSMIEDIENKMSLNIKDSEVNAINDNAGKSYVKVSPETFYVIERGKYYSDISDGHFDISIGPLVQLWGIGSDLAKVPKQDELENVLKEIGYENILLDKDNSSIMLAKEGMKIDLGAIAKGYAADVIADYLKSKNIERAILDLGGNVYVLGGKNDIDPWSIGIQNPFETRGRHIGALSLKDKTVVTSGIYERYFEVDGKRYHHILSPFDGYPVENSLASVSIIANKSIDADGLSTTIFSLGLEKGSELIESLDGIDAIFVERDKDVYITSGLEDNFAITNESFNLKPIK